MSLRFSAKARSLSQPSIRSVNRIKTALPVTEHTALKLSMNRYIGALLIAALLAFAMRCSLPRMGTAYCVEGGCKNGYGEQRVDFFGVIDKSVDNGFVGYSIYRGEFRDGLRWGKGTIEKRVKSIEGENYEGDFAYDKYHGYGKWERLITGPWPKEEMDSCPHRYEGQFQQGVPHGRGTLTTCTGKAYSGDFVNGAICYEGDCRNGRGAYLFWRGTHYRGEFRDGKRHGRGRAYDANNLRRYEGEFRDNHYNGHGVQIGYDSPQYKNGRWTDPEPYVRLEGAFVNGSEKGYGKKVYLKSGDVQEGEWNGQGGCAGPKCNGAPRAWPPDFIDRMREKAEKGREKKEE